MKNLKCRVFVNGEMLEFDTASIFDLHVINQYSNGMDGAKVMLFTGLHDFFGTEIYEDDIVINVIPKAHNLDSIAYEIVEWQTYDHRTGFNLDRNDSHSLRVVGNIHQNPNLILINTNNLI